jgi:photosystem II stability/assembly factor-like uncharacterized protein
MAAGAPAPADVQKRMRQDASVLVIVVPSDPSRRWRLTADRAIERSADSGRTWVQVRPAQGELTAGSAPSATVAWFVGANGLVLRTTDGTTFTRLPAPVAADLAEVSAADARVATVITADGRRFVTDDGGATWRQN